MPCQYPVDSLLQCNIGKQSAAVTSYETRIWSFSMLTVCISLVNWKISDTVNQLRRAVSIQYSLIWPIYSCMCRWLTIIMGCTAKGCLNCVNQNVGDFSILHLNCCNEDFRDNLNHIKSKFQHNIFWCWQESVRSKEKEISVSCRKHESLQV